MASLAPVIGVASGLLLVWLLLVLVFYVAGRRWGEPTRLRDAMRLLPDVVRLVRRLAADPSLPRGVRWRLGLLLGYLVMPIDLVPDVIPVAGYADDALLVAWVLRSVVRTCGAGGARPALAGDAGGSRRRTPPRGPRWLKRPVLTGLSARHPLRHHTLHGSLWSATTLPSCDGTPDAQGVAETRCPARVASRVTPITRRHSG